MLRLVRNLGAAALAAKLLLLTSNARISMAIEKFDCFTKTSKGLQRPTAIPHETLCCSR